jgi:hypothetical protein
MGIQSLQKRVRMPGEWPLTGAKKKSHYYSMAPKLKFCFTGVMSPATKALKKSLSPTTVLDQQLQHFFNKVELRN